MTGMASKEKRAARNPASAGRTAPPKPAALIWMPMVLAACCSPTRWLVLEIRPANMGAMANPTTNTPATPTRGSGFHHNKMEPAMARHMALTIRVVIRTR